MIQPGIFKHYKGPLYRVLFEAKWVWSGKGLVLIEDAELLVVARPSPAVQLLSMALYGEPLFHARWSGNTNNVEDGEAVVVYISLSEKGRVSVRTLKEFEENVKETGGPRFERIGA